jgi:hypothetical protein
MTIASGSVLSGFGTLNVLGHYTGGSLTASGGTLDVFGTVDSGIQLTIDSSKKSDLKIENSATSATAIDITAHNQTLEIGAAGNLTVGAGETVNGGTIQLDGGTLTDATGISFGGTGGNGLLIGSGTVSATLLQGATNTGTITASGGTLDLTGVFGSGLVATISAGSDLKFDGNATLVNAITMNNATQTLEVGTGAVVTFNVAESINPGNIKMSGGTLNDVGGISFGNGGGLSGCGAVTANLTGGSTDVITASGGTLDLTGTFGSGLVAAIDSVSSSDLKFDGTATIGSLADITSANQTLEVGSSGNLTFTGANGFKVAGGEIVLAGGSLIDAKGIGFECRHIDRFRFGQCGYRLIQRVRKRCRGIRRPVVRERGCSRQRPYL